METKSKLPKLIQLKNSITGAGLKHKSQCLPNTLTLRHYLQHLFSLYWDITPATILVLTFYNTKIVSKTHGCTVLFKKK